MKRVISIAFSIFFVYSVIGQTWPVSTSQSYTGVNFIYDNIIVQNGATLSLTNSTVLINYAGAITVEPGAKLVLKNCILNVSSGISVPNYWNGIVVLGDPTKGQTATDQGQLIIENSRVENALVGISVGNRKYLIDDQPTNFPYQNGGGIIKANGAIIANCRYGVIFNPYFDPALLSHPSANLSAFSGCTFMWDDNAQRDLCARIETGTGTVNLKTLVELNQVHDILFEGCEFNCSKRFSDWFLNDNIDYNFNFGFDQYRAACRGTGIKAMGASFQVQKGLPCANSYFGPYPSCKTCTGSPCLFEGLGVGIYIDGYKNNVQNYPGYPATNLEPRYEIVGAYFLNNRVGIIGYEMDGYTTSLVPMIDQATNPLKNIFINRCTFMLNDNMYSYHHEWAGDFIHLTNCGEIEISGNNFTWDQTSNSVKPAQPRPHFTMCSSDEYACVNLDNCNYGKVMINNNSYFLSKFKEEDCLRVFNFNTFQNLNSGLEVSCNTYSFAGGMEFRLGEPGTCFCKLNDWAVYKNNGGFSFGTQLPGNVDAGNIWSVIPFSPQTNTLVNNVYILGVDISDPSINYNYESGNISKEPLVTFDPNSKLVKNTVSNQNSCDAPDYCKYYHADKYSNVLPGGGIGPVAPRNDLPGVFLVVTSLQGGQPPVIIIGSYDPSIILEGVLSITDSDGQIIYSEQVTIPGGQQYYSGFDLSNLPPGTYYIQFTDSSGRIYIYIYIK